MSRRETNSEYRKNLLTGLGIGLALGIVFGSALEGLFPFPFDMLVGIVIGLLIGYRIGVRPSMLMRYPDFIVRRILMSGTLFILGMFGYVSLLDLDLSAVQQIWSSLLAGIPADFTLQCKDPGIEEVKAGIGTLHAVGYFVYNTYRESSFYRHDNTGELCQLSDNLSEKGIQKPFSGLRGKVRI